MLRRAPSADERDSETFKYRTSPAFMSKVYAVFSIPSLPMRSTTREATGSFDTSHANQ